MKRSLRIVAASGMVLGLLGLRAIDARTSPQTPVAPPRTLRALYGIEPVRRIEAAHTALLLVDFQREFFDGKLALPDAPAALAQAARLTRWAREHAVAVVFVRQVAAKPHSLLFSPEASSTAFVSGLEPQPGELVITKAMLGAFTRTSLHDQLRARSVDTLVVAGLMTHVAVQVSALDAAALGYRTLIVSDAVATRSLPGAAGGTHIDATDVQRVSLASLADRAADVLDTQSLLRLPVLP